MDFRESGIDGERPPVGVDREVEPSARLEHATQGDLGIGKVRPSRDGLLVGRLRVVEPGERDAGIAGVVVRSGIARIAGKCRRVRIQRALRVPAGQQDVAAVQVRPGKRRREADRLVVAPQRMVDPALILAGIALVDQPPRRGFGVVAGGRGLRGERCGADSIEEAHDGSAGALALPSSRATPARGARARSRRAGDRGRRRQCHAEAKRCCAHAGTRLQYAWRFAVKLPKPRPCRAPSSVRLLRV